LIGVPLKAQILAARPGHASNIEFARKIRKLYQQKQLVRKYQYDEKRASSLISTPSRRYSLIGIHFCLSIRLSTSRSMRVSRA